MTWASLYSLLVSAIAREFFVGQSRISLDSWSTRKVCYQLAMIHYWCALIGMFLHLPGLVRSLKNEVGQLTGEKASLQREVEKLRAEVSQSFSLFSLPTLLPLFPFPLLPPGLLLQVLQVSCFCLFSHRMESCRGSWRHSRTSWQQGQGIWSRLSMLSGVCVCMSRKSGCLKRALLSRVTVA